MNRVRYLLANLNVLNLLLAGVLFLLVNYMLFPFLVRSVRFSLPQAKTGTDTSRAALTPGELPKAPSPADYTAISEHNLFHPERIIPVEKVEGQAAPKPDFVLYGTLISGSAKLAFMDDLKAQFSSPGRGKRQRTIKIGQVLSGYTLSELFPDRVVMVIGDERIEVRVTEASKIKTTGPAKPAASAKPVVPLK